MPQTTPTEMQIQIDSESPSLQPLGDQPASVSAAAAIDTANEQPATDPPFTVEEPVVEISPELA